MNEAPQRYSATSVADSAPPLRRRTLLKALGVAGGLGALGAAGVTARELLADEGAYFDLNAPSRPFAPVQRNVLHETYQVSQSFGFDHVNDRIFFAQVEGGSDGNDLCISQLDRNGVLVGYMHIPDVGHGVSFGVEPVGTTTYLWTEAESSTPAEDGRGTALQRFAWRSGEEPEDAQLFLRGSENITCAIDADVERLLVRQHYDGESEFQVHDLAAAREGDFSKPLTPGIRPKTERSVQGYTFFGDYLYILNGGFSESPDDITSALSCFNLYTGEAVQRQVLQTVARDLPFREPEGMAVFRTRGGRPRLCFGLASTQETVRFANVFCKDDLVAV